MRLQRVFNIVGVLRLAGAQVRMFHVLAGALIQSFGCLPELDPSGKGVRRQRESPDDKAAGAAPINFRGADVLQSSMNKLYLFLMIPR
jgi:hypothetical protein